MRPGEKVAMLIVAVPCAIWFGFFFLAALVMSTGLADEPGSTNGLGRFLFWFAVSSPGLLGMILCALALKSARPRDPTGGRRGFAVIADDDEPATDRAIAPPETIENWQIK